MSVENYDFIIVGGGIVGLATAYKLQIKFPDRSIAILEKENKIGKHQTGRNSGVIHSGIYYKPGSYKAKNCKNGRDQLVDFAKKYKIKHDICGKLIVATVFEELPILESIYQRGIENKTQGIRYLNSDEIKKKEPFIDGVKAIWVPIAGITNYVDVGHKLVELLTVLNPKSKLIVQCQFLDSKLQNNKNIVSTSLGEFTTNQLIFCGGLFADRIAEKNGVKLDMQIVGFRGDYYELTARSKHKIKNLVYPVPDVNFPFLGVHFTRMIDGSVECGPNAVFSFEREGYKNTSFNLKDTWQALTFKGTWKLFSRNWRKGIDEYKRAYSKRLFVNSLQKMMPSITINDVQPSRAGVRAQALDSNGCLVDDFKIIELEGNIHVLNAPSPAATSCLAIADEIVKKII
jgi:L-2-hydroxyglutarate oxidase